MLFNDGKLNRNNMKPKANSKTRIKRKDLPVSLIIQRDFQQFTLSHFQLVHGKIETKKFKRPTTYAADENVMLPHDEIEEKIFFKKIVLYPEAIPFLFTLEGCPKRLFLYLLLYKEEQEGAFIFNSSVIEHFRQFCEIYPPVYNQATVKQAMKHLRAQNIILNCKKGLNIINPLITGGNNEKDRIRLIKEYNFQLIQRDLDTYRNFYPRIY